MKMARIACAGIAGALMFAAAVSASAQDVRRGAGGSIKTQLSPTIVLNDKSSLEREWIVVDDPRMPAGVAGLAGVKTVYESGRVRGDYKYRADVGIDVRKPLRAVQIIFVLFDVWGRHTKSLNLTEISDFAPGRHRLSASWNLHSENETSEFYASIAYVARVRTADGQVIEMDRRVVTAEGKKFSAKFSEGDVEPKSQ